MVDLEAAGCWRLEQRDGIAAAAVRPHFTAAAFCAEEARTSLAEKKFTGGLASATGFCIHPRPKRAPNIAGGAPLILTGPRRARSLSINRIGLLACLS